MNLSRRRTLLAAASLLPLWSISQAKADTTDLVVLCDLTLGPVLRKTGAAFLDQHDVLVHVFPTAPGLIEPQLAHDVQCDLVVSQLTILDLAREAGLLAQEIRSASWRSPLVVAELANATGSPDSGKFAVSELASAAGIDGAGVAANLGLAPSRIVSAIDTTEVAFLLTSGAARAGLLYLTDVRADPRLRVLHPITDPPPATFAAAVTKGARRPNPAAFIAFLATPPSSWLLAAGGLEPAT